MTVRKQTSWLSGKQARPSRLALASLATVLAVILSACSSSVNTPEATASGPQLYMTPNIDGGGGGVRGTFSIDDAALTFAQETYAFSSTQSGAQVNYSGDLASPGLARGLKELELSYACGTPANAGAECSGGRVNSEVMVTITGKPSKTELRGPISGGGPKLKLRTSGGGISVKRLVAAN